MNYFTYVDSPIGMLKLSADERAVTALAFEPGAGASARPHERRPGEGIEEPNAGPLPAAVRQLAEYFAGSRRAFDVPLAPHGTPFQARVWRALMEIPFGATASYGEIARRVEKPGAARAVGLANNRNPIAILVPCHRVIGADGSLTGYGGGIERKRWLLELEGGVEADARSALKVIKTSTYCKAR